VIKSEDCRRFSCFAGVTAHSDHISELSALATNYKPFTNESFRALKTTYGDGATFLMQPGGVAQERPATSGWDRSDICGVIGRHSHDQGILPRMIDCMLDEDHPTTHTYIENRVDCAVGWLAASGDNVAFPFPLWSQTGSVGLVFSGETFDSGGAGSLADEYEKRGLEALRQLNGTFRGFLIDLRKREATLFNDRYGLGRVYYHESNDSLFFSSQAKALLKLLPNLRELDPNGVAEWLSCGCALQNKTLFRDVSLLPAGSAWTFAKNASKKKQRYFDPKEWEAQPTLAAPEYYSRLQQVLPRVVNRYFAGDAPIGMSLTGGVDGRMVMAWTSKKTGELPCYTFNGSYRDCADVKIGRRVAKACGQSHETILVAEEFLSRFPTLAEETVYVSDGAMDITAAADLYANRIARRIAPIRMTGNYGSEILRSHVAFKPSELPNEIFDREITERAQQAGLTYQNERQGKLLSFIAFKQVPWHHYGRLAAEQSQIGIRSPFLDNEIVSLAFQAPAEAANNPTLLLQLIAAGNPILAQIPTDRGLTYPSQSLTEARRSLAEFLAKAEYAFDYGMPQWLSRFNRMFAVFQLDRLFLGRQKFCHYRTWYQHRLANYVRDIILDSRTRSRPYLRRDALEGMVSAHRSGSGNFTTTIHKILSLELVQRLLIEQT
jgi:asparagine synthase (glutamine-hydrolysing)